MKVTHKILYEVIISNYYCAPNLISSSIAAKSLFETKIHITLLICIIDQIDGKI